jgi:hypothetical protein
MSSRSKADLIALLESIYELEVDVEITAASTVPSGAIVGYAATSDGTALSGVSRRWGKLIDSDRTVGAFTGQAQPNFAVAFEMTMP